MPTPDNESATLSLSDMQRELRELRASLEALTAAAASRRRLRLRAARDNAFLGQPRVVRAEVTDPTGKIAQLGVPVTFVATWGRLQATRSARLEEAHTVTVPTDGEGVARVVLKPPTSEGLVDSQQRALEAALYRMDADAATPHATLDGLQDMARQYRWEAGEALRQAVDVYLRDFRPNLLDTVNTADYLAEWMYFDCTIMAFVAGDAQPDEGTTADSSAALLVRFKDWLGPWLEVSLGVAQEGSELDLELDRTIALGGDAPGLLADVYGRVQAFKNRQYGLVGDYLGKRIADRSLRDLATNRLGDLPASAQVELGAALHTASNAITSAGLGVATAVGQVQSTLGKDLAGRIEQVRTVDLGRVEQSVTTLEGRVAGMSPEAVGNLRTEMLGLLASKADASRLTELGSAFDARLAAKADLAAIDNLKGLIGTKADASAVDGLRTRIDSKLDAAQLATVRRELIDLIGSKADVSAVQGLRGELTTALGTKADTTALQGLRSELTTALGAKADSGALAGLNTRVGSLEQQVPLKADASALSTLRADFSEALQGKLDLGAFTEFRTLTTQTLATKADSETLSTFRTEFTSLLGGKADATALETVKGDFSTGLAGLNASLTTLDRDLGTLRTSTAAQLAAKPDRTELTTLRSDMNTALAAKAERSELVTINTRLNTLNEATTRLDTSLNTLDSRVGRLDAAVTPVIRPGGNLGNIGGAVLNRRIP